MSDNKQHPGDAPALFYRYDGVDEHGQHWLELLEKGKPTEHYVPIQLKESDNVLQTTE